MGNGKRKQTSDDEQVHSDSESESLSKKTTKNVVQPAEGSSKPKTVKKPKIGNIDEDVPSSPSRSKSSQPAVKIFQNPEGDKYVDLGKKKRATVRAFKGQVFVDIREFYGTDGDEKPGKKGISLQFEQWEALKKSMTTIDALFEEQGKK